METLRVAVKIIKPPSKGCNPKVARFILRKSAFADLVRANSDSVAGQIGILDAVVPIVTVQSVVRPNPDEPEAILVEVRDLQAGKPLFCAYIDESGLPGRQNRAKKKAQEQERRAPTDPV